MAHLKIRVPETHVEALRRELARAYDERMEASRSALSEERAHGAQVEADDLREALEQEGPVFTAHPEVLSDAVHALLAGALRGLAAAVDAYWRGADARAEVAARLGDVTTLVELLTTVQEGH